MRGSDRLEGWVRILGLCIALLAIVLAVTAGLSTADAAAIRIRHDNATKTPVTAVVLPEPSSTENGWPGAQQEALVRWVLSHRTGTATVYVPGSAKPGDSVEIWLDPAGHPTAHPRPLHDADVQGIDRGFVTVLAIWSGTAALVWAAGRYLTGRRNAEWAREWRHLAPGIGQDK